MALSPTAKDLPSWKSGCLYNIFKSLTTKSKTSTLRGPGLAFWPLKMISLVQTLPFSNLRTFYLLSAGFLSIGFQGKEVCKAGAEGRVCLCVCV